MQVVPVTHSLRPQTVVKTQTQTVFFQPVHLYDITGDLLNMAALPTDLWDSCGMHASTARCTYVDVHMLFSVNYHLMVYIVSPLEILLFAANKKLRNISCLRSV